jgi:hypothetical protein
MPTEPWPSSNQPPGSPPAWVGRVNHPTDPCLTHTHTRADPPGLPATLQTDLCGAMPSMFREVPVEGGGRGGVRPRMLVDKVR